jgi:dihydropteroate synthase-like protein
MSRPHLLFVTGKLAEPALRRALAELAPAAGFEPAVAVLPITVVALATTPWVARHLSVPAGIDRVVLPGLCAGDLAVVEEKAGVPVERGPRDLRDLPEFFGRGGRQGPPPGYGAFDVEILAEINHAPRLPPSEVLEQARRLHADGADVIDVGCDPGTTWAGVGDCVRGLRAEGLRVSIDSFNAAEVEEAAAAGAELVLSVNGGNAAGAKALYERYGCSFVAVPDTPADLDGLDRTVRVLRDDGVPFRIDPVLEPIAFGFAASLGRYLEVRRRHPDAEIMMGVGNLTELTDCDSAAVNVLLLGVCQELGVRSVLTTQVINWCRTCVRELDLARRLVGYACRERVLPKHLEPGLVLLRDPKVREHGDETLRELAARVTDRNFRLFAERGKLIAFNGRTYAEGTDPFELFARLSADGAIDPSHAFYLGYELAKAVTALTLGKTYVQDQALRWGFLTVPEVSHRGEAGEPGA